MIDVFHELYAMTEARHAESVLSTGVPFAVPFPTCPLAKTVETVERQGATGMYTAQDVSFRKVKMSMHNVGQTQKSCDSYVGNAEDALQSILIDPRLDQDRFFLQASDVTRTYTDQHGNELHGFEPWHGDFWRALESTIPEGGTLLCIAVHSDETDTKQGNRYPYRVVPMNIPLSARKLDGASRTIGYGGIMNMFRKRGAKRSDKLNDEQRNAKSAIGASIAAVMLAPLDAVAAQPRTFNVRTARGLVRRDLHIRAGCHNADFDEKKTLLALKGWACPRCLGYEHALRARLPDSPGNEDLDDNPHMCSLPGSLCGTARRRTVRSTLKRQVKLMNMKRYGATLTQVAAAQQGTSINPAVECMSHRLQNLIPEIIGGPYVVHVVEILHSFNLGVAARAVALADAYVNYVMQPTENCETPDDARFRVDTRLGAIPPMRRLLTFKSGWFEANDSGTASGAENVALLLQYPFVLVEDDTLIPDQQARTRLLELLWGLVMLGQELRTPQWYTDDDLTDLGRKLVAMTDGFKWLQEELGDLAPGRGMDIPKYHEVMAAVQHIRSHGSLQNGSCDWGERLMRFVKEADARIGRSRKDDGGERLSSFISALETDAALAARVPFLSIEDDYEEESEPAVRAAVSGHVRPGFSIGCEKWAVCMSELVSGKNGPPVHPQILEKLLSTLSDWGEEYSVTARSQELYSERDLYTKTSSPRVLRPGHCLELCTGNYCQTLAVGLTLNGDPENVSMAVWQFGACSPEMHPELHLRHLRRGFLKIISQSRILRRAHIVPIFKATPDNFPMVRYATNFLVNAGIYENVVGPRNRQCFLSCQTCSTPVLQPDQEGAFVTCTACGLKFRWM